MCYEWCTVNCISLFLLKGTCQSCGVDGPNLWACLQVRSLFPNKHVRQVECIFRPRKKNHNYYSLCPAFPTVWLSLCRLRRISFWSQYYTCTGDILIHSVIQSILWHSFCSVIIHIRFFCTCMHLFSFFPGQKTQSDSKLDHVQGVVLCLWEGGVSGTKACYSCIISSPLQTTWMGKEVIRLFETSHRNVHFLGLCKHD